MMTYSRIHHVALHNYFLPYNASKREPTELLVKFQDTSYAAFREQQNLLVHQFRELHAQVGTEHKQAGIISQSEEEILWENVVDQKLHWVY